MIPNLLLYVKPVTLSQGLTNQTAPGVTFSKPPKTAKNIPYYTQKSLKTPKKRPKTP